MCKTNRQIHFFSSIKTLLVTLSIVLTGIIGSGLSSHVIAQDKPQPPLPSVELKVAGKSLSTELASTPNQRYYA